MNKFYKSNSRKLVRCFKTLQAIILVTCFCVNAQSQVTLTATAGIPTGSFITLSQAFTAINSGSHKGDIIININANTDEGTSPATLNSSNADPAGYTSILIQPTGNNIVVSGDPGSGYGVIQLNGADNITINGDNPNVAGQNRNLTIENNSASTVVGGSCIRIATSSVVSTANNISILNCILNGNVTSGNTAAITAANSSAAISFGIYVGGNGGATATTAPSPVSAAMEAAPAGSSIKPLSVQNNAVNQCGKGIVFNAVNTTVSNNVSITQNLIGTPGALGSYPYSTPATTVYSSGIWISGCSAITVSGNTIHNIISYVTASFGAIFLNTTTGTGAINITNNTVTGVSSNGGSNLAAGIVVNSGGLFDISGNTISTIETNGSTQTTPASGIIINSANAGGIISSNKIANIFNRNSGGFSAQGINLAAVSNGVAIQNNFISSVMNEGTSSFFNGFNANGILLNSGKNHKVYFNSVNLYGASGSTGGNAINCLAITAPSQTGIDIRNNIFSNKVTGGGPSDVHTCIFMPFAASAAMNLTLNNNGYYTGNTAGLHGIGFAGTTTYNIANLYTVGNFNPLTTAGASNWRNFSSSLGDGSNDFASFGLTIAAPFVSTSDLHIPAATLTQLESGGTPVGVGDDIDNTIRNGTFPDIGADEFTGTRLDATPPLINYIPLRNDCSIGNRQLNVTITDPSGVPTVGLGLPVLYWKINALSYIPSQGVSIGSGVYQFTFGTGAVLGDVVSYYIVAQDGDTPPNVTSSPSTGATGYTSNPPASATPPTTPESYTIVNALNAGTYTVGSGGGNDYTTITAAVNAYNNSCLNGAVIFKLVSPAYPSETYPIVINNAEANATKTLTIQPNSGVAVSLTGNNATSLFKLYGADYITFDGLNSGGSSWSITNSNSSGSVFWIASAPELGGATHNVIRNCGISGAGTTGTGVGVITGDGASLASTATASNSDNTISSCTFKSLQDGVFINGYTVVADANWMISNNTFGSSVASEKLGYRAITLQYVNNFTITGNVITGIARTSAVSGTNSAGIGIYYTATNGSIVKNKISDIVQNAVLAGSYGIILQSYNNAANILVNNNFISNVSANGSSTIDNTATGIYVALGGGYQIYFNSVGMPANASTSANITAAFRISPSVNTPGAINLRNNIFSNVASFGAKYSIYNGSTANVLGIINNNDYFISNGPGALGFLSGNITTLANWQIATSDDSRSLVINPMFISAGDLHLQPTSPLNSLGVTLPGLTTDIDGDTRAGTPDIGADEFDGTNCAGTPVGGTISSSLTSLCNSGSATLTATGFTAGDGISFQWQSSTDNFVSAPTNLAGQTIPSNANTGVISLTTYYRLAVTCSNGGAIGYSNVLTISVNNPSVTSTTPASRCGTGTVNLAAVGSAGTNLYWFSAATGGPSIGFGPSFLTPVISATTTYYVQASSATNTGSVGPLSPTAEGGIIGIQTVDWDVLFDVLQTTTLVSVDIFPNTSGLNGSITIRNSVGAIVGATVNYVTNVSGGATAQTISLNIALTPGTGYYMESSGSVPNLTRNESGATYPYNSSAIKITGNGFDNTYYMCYYNFRYSSACISARTAVTATVTAAPSIVVNATPNNICAGSSSSLTV
ncbi:MAG: hypothetical protein ABIO04_08000, partial [Ferruginibacter sp.]